jgi:raffinose/stachyose/melibiose transport system substrate-binding protein
MKRMRTVILILTLIFTANVIFGCSKPNNSASPSPTETGSQSESPSPSPGEGDTEKVIVDIFHYRPELHEALSDAVKEFTKENEDIKINIETAGEDQEYSAALRARFNSNVAPAIFNISSPKDIAEWKGKLLDVSKMEIKKNAIESYLEGVTNEGKVLGLPYYIQGYGLIYNMKILEKAQIEIKDVDTFSALEDMIKIWTSRRRS